MVSQGGKEKKEVRERESRVQLEQGGQKKCFTLIDHLIHAAAALAVSLLVPGAAAGEVLFGGLFEVVHFLLLLWLWKGVCVWGVGRYLGVGSCGSVCGGGGIMWG